MNQAACGTWKSPISASDVADSGVSLSSLTVVDGRANWLERRPLEGGRSVLVSARDGRLTELSAAGFSIRSRVNEYGGAPYCLHGDTLWFCNDADQRIYRQAAGDAPVPLTPAQPHRYADLTFDAWRNRLLAIREDHTRDDHEPANAIVAIAPDGTLTTLIDGADFYASPVFSPNGRQLAWLSWNHPDMPWDATALWLADIDASGLPQNARQVAGGPEESIFQPQWSPEGQLHFVSDRSDWWNLYRIDAQRQTPLCPMNAEFGRPQWVFGMSAYGFTAHGDIVACYSRDGRWHLTRIDADGHHDYDLPYDDIQELRVGGDQVWLLAAAADCLPGIIEIDVRDGRHQRLAHGGSAGLETAMIAIPEAFSFASGKAMAHAFYYPPTHADFAPLPNEAPPLIVKIHGGPTAATSTALNPQIQFWTSRGFALVDVNYRGSTGYGRRYREALHGEAGIADVEDCINAARHLIAAGRADANRCLIRGSSAGGFTALAALTFHRFFRAGASYYGIGDLSALARDTHKFEARYIDRLVAPWPEGEALYRARSPLEHVAQLAAPVIFFQGLDDKVVPPNQAEDMVNALVRKGLPVAYLTFEGEAHGFRRAETLIRTLEAELSFYGQVLGFEPDDDIEAVAIRNLDANA
ncbi:MAG: S9 family peptidase [Gammaproteobacteria bacterium]|nr:S9 family peptidase [Gammaproteobacteria bacterium]MCP5135595.1 S9 family peptidase [Gammaproteobacteria bacterium]